MDKTSKQNMVTVAQASDCILQQRMDFGRESIGFADCAGRILAEDLIADRDMPPFNRVAMDGIAVVYAAIRQGIRCFKVKAVQAAGAPAVELEELSECVEIMTGAALPAGADVVIPYEQLDRNGESFRLKEGVAPLQGQYIHARAKDRKAGEVLLRENRFISLAVVNTLAAIGKSTVRVKQKPRVLIVTTGDELVDLCDTPKPIQIRRSSNYALAAALKAWGITADQVHLPDDVAQLTRALQVQLQAYDVLLLTGGVSMGKFDYVPQVLESLGVEKLFHKVQQKPGKPFWFGKHPAKTAVFAFPGNPVSTYLCFQRYFMPWLQACWCLPLAECFAVLDQDYHFAAHLTHFLLVKLVYTPSGSCRAIPVAGNGSGDYAALLEADAFMELPADRAEFKAGEAWPIWPFQRSLS